MLKAGTLILFAAFAAVPPIPQTAPPSQPPANSQRAEAPAKDSAYERGTDKSPVIVKLVRTEEDKAESERQKTEREGQAVTEKKLADYTWYLALATIALVLVAAAQAGLFVWQLLYMRQGLKDAAEAASAATKQAEIAQATFEKLERPYLYVTMHNRFRVEDMFDSYVTYSVFNHGKIAAKIQAVYIQNGKSVNWEPTDELLIDLNDNLLANRVMGPGEERLHLRNNPAHEEDLKWGSDGYERWPLIGANDAWFFTVRIVYDGPFTEGHVTKASWRFHIAERTFQEYGGERHNFVT